MNQMTNKQMYKKFLKIIISNLFFVFVVFNQNAISKPIPPGSGEGDVPANILILLDSSASMKTPLIAGDGISIEVLNGTNNEESKKQLLYNYVIGNYGGIENSSSPNWTGYKRWNIGGREIIYSKTYYRKKFLIEKLQISNAEYMPYLTDNEPNDE